MAAGTPASDRPTPAAPLPEETLRVAGSARLVLVINLGSFVSEGDAEAFRHLRGSEAFAAALRALRPRPPFLLDTETARIEQDAYTLRIFRSRLIYNHFFPTYRVSWDSTMRARMRAAGCADVDRWQRWTGRIRLSRSGLAVITLDQPFQDISLVACAEQILERPTQGEQPDAHDQWTIAMNILEAFLGALDRRMLLPLETGTRTISFTTPVEVRHTLRLDRYVIYALRRIERDGRLLEPQELKREHARTLAAFLTSRLLEYGGMRRFPLQAESLAHTLIAGDVASWEEELCLFTGESALIYFPSVGAVTYVGGPLGLDARAYAAYWAGIVRGVEHMVAFRAEAQQVERRTTGLLNQIPGLTRKVNDGHLSLEDHLLLDHLAAGLSDIFDSLPELRSMAVSTTAFRSDVVRRKFDVLLNELAVHETLALVNTNVEQLNFFLSYYNDMRLQWQGQRTNTLGLALGAIVLFMAISSFLADTFNVIDVLSDPRQHGWAIITWIATVAGGLLILGLMIWRSRKLFNRLFSRRMREVEEYSARLAAASGQVDERG